MVKDFMGLKAQVRNEASKEKDAEGTYEGERKKFGRISGNPPEIYQ
jgi:hypothetical protein